MLVIGDKLLYFLLSVYLIHPILLRSAGSESEQSIDQCLPAILRLDPVWKQSTSSLDQILSDALSQALVRLLPEALHEAAELLGAARVDLLQRDLHQHGVETSGCAFGLELSCGPLELADLAESQQVQSLQRTGLDRSPDRLRVELWLEGEVERQIDDLVVV